MRTMSFIVRGSGFALSMYYGISFALLDGYNV